jgi:putative DNA primase/helicase
VAPYLLERAEEFPDARVIVIDDCERCDAINKELDRRQPRNSIVSVAWAAGLAGTTPSDTDWTALAGRRLICVAMNDKISIKHAIDLLETLRENGVNDPTFKLCSESELRGEPANLLDAVLAAEDLSAHRFVEVADRLYSITIVPKTARHGWTPPQPDADYILSPLIKKRTITLLHSAPGAGKTWLAAIMGYFAAAGSTFQELWHAEKPRKVLFIRTEETDGLPEILAKIDRTFGQAAALQNVVLYPNSNQDFSTTLNLVSEKVWEKIARYVDDADLIVIDHLKNVTGGRDPRASWKLLVPHLRRQTRRGKSILLLHHDGKDGSQLGPTDHVIDVDLEISMQQKPNVRDRVQVEFGKVRDNVNFGKDFKPFVLHWKNDSQTDKMRWWIEKSEDEEKGIGAERPEVDPVPARVINEVYLADHFEQDEASVLRCLATAALKDIDNMPRADIDKEIGVSKSTTLGILRKLKTAGNIVVEGDGRATRYRLSDKMLEDVFQKKVMYAT